jgi:two-component system, OmpR family, phosphate regulon sensor histidine kinase PhoR
LSRDRHHTFIETTQTVAPCDIRTSLELAVSTRSRSLIRTFPLAAVPLVAAAAAVGAGLAEPGPAWALAAVSIAVGSWVLLIRPLEQRLDKVSRESGELAEKHSGTVGDLRRDRDLLGSILDAMQEGLLVLDQSDHIVLVNPALRSGLLLRAEVVGQSLQAALGRDELSELVRRARCGEQEVSGEIQVGDLKPRRFEVRVSRTRTPADGMLLAFFDVTEIRRLESMRRDFVANVSHELRTPVASVCSASETLLQGALADPAASRMFVEIIERNSERLRRLDEDLLDISRLESKQFELEREDLAVVNIAEHALSLLREKARLGRVRMDLEVPSELPSVKADRRALEQVMVNLVDNAIKYCPPGSRVVVRARRDGQAQVRVAVEDTGPGVAERDLPRLFERFYRVDPGRSRDMGGTGLGLSIVKHLVEAMGGDVGVESRVGFGSIFWFTLPVA